MADTPEIEAQSITATPKTYLASVVCQVIRTRDLRDKGQLQLRWSSNGRFFPPYLVPVETLEKAIAAVRNAIGAIVTSLENNPEWLKNPAEIHNGESLNGQICAMALAGNSLYKALLPKQDATQREIDRWLKALAAEDRVDTVEIQIDDECADDLTKPLPTIPWNLLFDYEKFIKRDELLARLNAGDVDDWGYFWGAKFDLSCGKNVNPLKADSPIDLETVTLVVMMDETILANLNKDTVAQAEFEDLLARIDALRDPDSPAGRIVHVMHDMASLENFIEERNQTPDVLYWLSHAKSNCLYLEFLDGRPGEDVTVDRLAATFTAAENPKRLVAFLNGCQTAESSEKGSFLNAFRKLDFCDGLIATERETLDVFAHRFGMEFLESFFIRQLPLGRILHNLRRTSLPLGLLYGTYCPPNIRIVRKSDRKTVKREAPYRIAPELGASLRKLSAASLTIARETHLANATVKPPAPPQPWPDKPYPSLGFYTLKDQALFLGREEDSARLAELIDSPQSRLLLLHGTSGSGKSSVIRAGLVPYLEKYAVGYRFPRRPKNDGLGETEDLHLFFRPSDNFAARLAADLLAFTDPAHPYPRDPRPDGTPQEPVNLRPILARCVDPLKSDVTLAELQKALDAPETETDPRPDPDLLRKILDELTAAIPEKLVVTIDQAEELYTLALGDTPEEIERADRRRKQAFALLRGCLRGSGRWKVILSYRTEYHGRITDGIRAGLKKTPGLADYLITDLGKEQLKRVLLRPTLDHEVIEGLESPRDKYGFVFEDGVVDQIVDQIFELRGRNSDSVLPIAQVICARIYQKESHRFVPGRLTIIRNQVRNQRSILRSQSDESILKYLVEYAESCLSSLSGGNSQISEALKRLMMNLYLIQPDGSLTSAQMNKSRALDKFWEGKPSEFDELISKASSLRLLREETATGSKELEESTVRLGHDTLCKVAESWNATEHARLAKEQGRKAEAEVRIRELQRRRLRLMRVGLVSTCVVCIIMVTLAIYANKQRRLALIESARSERSAREAMKAKKEAEESADMARSFGAEAINEERRATAFASIASILLAQNEYHSGSTKEARRTLFTVPEGERSFSWGLLHHMLNGRSFELPSDRRDRVNAVEWSPDGAMMASASDDKTVKIWDSTTRRLLFTLIAHTSPVMTVGISPSGNTLASGAFDGSIKIWDIRKRKELRTLTGHKNSVSSINWSPDGQMLASGSVDNNIKLWNASDGVEIRTLTGHKNSVSSINWSPDGRTLASGSEDKTIKFWNISNGVDFLTSTGHKDSVCSVRWSPDGRTLASGSEDKTIKLWNVSDGVEFMTLSGHKDSVSSVSWSPNARVLATGASNGTIMLWDVRSGEELMSVSGHLSSVTSVNWSPVGECLASSSSDKSIKLWNLLAGNERRTISTFQRSVASLSLSPNGRTIAAGSSDGSVELWDVRTGAELLAISGHKSSVTSVSWSPYGHTLASGSADKTIKLWNVSDGVNLLTLIGHKSSVSSVSWSPDARLLAAGASNGTIMLWDVRDGEQLVTFSGHIGSVTSVCWSPDGRTLASSSADNTIMLWDVKRGSEPKTLIGHTSAVTEVSWSPDGRTLASSSADNTIRLWDAIKGTELRTLTGHSSEVTTVKWSPDGRIFASGSLDNSIKLWDSEYGKQVSNLACKDSVSSLSFGTSDSAVMGRIGQLYQRSGKIVSAGTIRLCASIANDIQIWSSDIPQTTSLLHYGESPPPSSTVYLEDERIARSFLRFYPLYDEAISAIRRNETLTSEEKARIAGIIQPLIDFQHARAAANAIPLPDNVFQP